MTQCVLFVIASAFVVCDETSADRALIARLAADEAARATAPAAGAPAPDDLARSEAAARIDLSLAQARLDLIVARRALKEGDAPRAARLARAALNSLAGLPADVDASVYELQAEGILARLGEPAAAPSMGQLDDAPAGPPQALPAPPIEREDPLDRKARAAAAIARAYDGADTAEIDTRGDAAALRERTLERQTPHRRYGYRPAEEIVDVEAILERDQQRYFYERALREAYKAAEARLLTEADEARVVGDGVVAYPDDWPQRVARRAEYADGQIARSGSWIDKDGREWYIAIYDVQDLTYVPPDFQPTDGLPLTRQLRDTLDRGALRQYSHIFGGYAEDLAAGIPLLRYFGGVDDLEYRGPKYSAERQRQLVEQIRRFVAERTAQPDVAP